MNLIMNLSENLIQAQAVNSITGKTIYLYRFNLYIYNYFDGYTAIDLQELQMRKCLNSLIKISFYRPILFLFQFFSNFLHTTCFVPEGTTSLGI